MLPVIKIKRDSRVKKYYIYRGYDTKDLPENIAVCKTQLPDIIVENTGEGDTLTIIDTANNNDPKVTINNEPKFFEKFEILVKENYINNKGSQLSINILPNKLYSNLYYVVFGINGDYVTILSQIVTQKITVSLDNIVNYVEIGDITKLALEENKPILLKYEDFNSNLKKLNSDDVSYNLKYLYNDGAINLEIKNIFNKDSEYLNRTTKDIKVIHKYFNSIEVPSEEYDCKVDSDTFVMDVKIPIDALFIYRKEDDGTNEPIPIDGEGASKKKIVRYGGNFDEKEEEYDNIGDGLCEKDSYIIYEQSNLKNFRLCDKGILPNKVYKYTIYLFSNMLEYSDYTFKVET